jgi:hypothetical protein
MGHLTQWQNFICAVICLREVSDSELLANLFKHNIHLKLGIHLKFSFPSYVHNWLGVSPSFISLFWVLHWYYFKWPLSEPGMEFNHEPAALIQTYLSDSPKNSWSFMPSVWLSLFFLGSLLLVNELQFQACLKHIKPKLCLLSKFIFADCPSFLLVEALCSCFSSTLCFFAS